MLLTLQMILDDKGIMSSIIDRALVKILNMDKVFWKDYLIYDEANPDGTFKTYTGTQIGVIAGTVIDRFARKPVRKRQTLSSGYGEVACLGDQYQIDETRLDRLNTMIRQYNNANAGDQQKKLNDIVNFLVDDMRNCLLAPMKRFDLMMGDMRFTGGCSVDGKANKKGVSIQDITLPIYKKSATAADKDHILTWFNTEFVNKIRSKGFALTTMEMNQATFNTYIATSAEFKSAYVMKFGDMEINTGNIVTPDMVNRLLVATGSPLSINIREEWVQISQDEMKNAVPDGMVSLIPTLDPLYKMGYLKWRAPYEMQDNVPGKTYTMAEDGKMFIASKHTEEGRFLEYGMEGIPDIEIPNKMAIADLTALA